MSNEKNKNPSLPTLRLRVIRPLFPSGNFHINQPNTQEEADRMMATARQMMAASLNWQDRKDTLARPGTPLNSWSQRFLNYFKNPDGSYSDPTNPDDPANYPGFQGYDDQGIALFPICRPDGSFAGYSHHPQLHGG